MIGVLSGGEIEEVLERNTMGRLAMCAGAQPYVVPIDYGYDGRHLFCLSGPGRKIEMMRAQPLVGFLVDEIEHRGYWRSVFLEGQFEEISTLAEREGAVGFLQGRQQLQEAVRLLADSEVILFRVVIASKAGRFEHRDP